MYTSKEPTVSIYEYQCSSCLSIYDSRFGDIQNDKASGVPFEQLPDDYCYLVYDTPKADFMKKNKAVVV